MTAIQFVERILEEDWDPDISGRSQIIPKPEIVRESSDEHRRMNLQRSDYLVLMDGGISEIAPQSFGWSEESLTSRVTCDFRTSTSRERLWGHRQQGNTSPRYAGLVGEAKRIVDNYRKGTREFDLITGYEANDLSGQMGGKVWRATFDIRLETRASVIDPSK
jgi:hypothetical protein